jgi:DNA-binding PadR family transcriptional regulator
MLDLAVLGLLEERELHGYELRRRLRDQLGVLANVSFGSIYPALSRLESSGAVETVEPAPSSGPLAPPTGSLSGEWAMLRARRHAGARGRRSRKVYRITPAGKRLFLELLSETGTDDARSFGLRLAFARHLAPQARLGLLERRRAQLFQRLAEVRPEAAGEPLDSYARSVIEHAADGVEADIRWIDGLVANERTMIAAPPRKTGPRLTTGPTAREGGHQ